MLKPLLQSISLTVLLLLLLHLCDSQSALSFLNPLEAHIFAFYAEDVLLECFQSLVSVFKHLNEPIVKLVFEYHLRFDNRFNQLLDSRTDLQISHESVDLEMALVWQ